MFCFTQLLITYFWIILNQVETRHVPLSSQTHSAQARPRLLVIRPPAGSPHPNRVVVLTNPRFAQNEPRRGDPSRAFAARTVIPGQPDSPPPSQTNHDHSTGGHPNSQARRMGTARRSGTTSLRNMIADLRNNQRPSRAQSSNIARLSDKIPRAAAAMVPRRNRYGQLNMPSVIEEALRRMRTKANQRGGTGQIREIPARAHNQQSINDIHSDRSTFNGMLDRSGISPTEDINVRSVPNSSSMLSRQTTRGVNDAVRMNMGRNGLRGSNPENLNSRISTARNGRGGAAHSSTQHAHPNEIRGIRNSKHEHRGHTGSNLRNMDQDSIANKVLTQNATIGSVKPVQPTSNVKQYSTGVSSPSIPAVSANINATAEIQASSNSTSSNTTSTKSVKTKTIKVTTIVKGGTAADIAAAAASQAEIANAVAQGKDINSTSLKSLKTTTKAKQSPPAGSITVKREPNGVSVITLADGQGEPVTIRATGRVKIERIVNADGRVQFLINPVVPTVYPEDIEADEMTTASALYFGFGNPTSDVPSTTTTPLVTTTFGPIAETTTVPTVPTTITPDAPTTLEPTINTLISTLPPTQRVLNIDLVPTSTVVSTQGTILTNGQNKATTIANDAINTSVTKRAPINTGVTKRALVGSERSKGENIGMNNTKIGGIFNIGVNITGNTDKYSLEAGKVITGISTNLKSPVIGSFNNSEFRSPVESKTNVLNGNASINGHPGIGNVDFSSWFKQPKIPRPPSFIDLFRRAENKTHLRNSNIHIGQDVHIPSQITVSSLTTKMATGSPSPPSTGSPSPPSTGSPSPPSTLNSVANLTSRSSAGVTSSVYPTTLATDTNPQYEIIKSTPSIEIVPHIHDGHPHPS